MSNENARRLTNTMPVLDYVRRQQIKCVFFPASLNYHEIVFLKNAISQLI